MKYLRPAIWAGFAFVIGILAIAYLLPSQYKVVRSVGINATPEKIYPLLANPREWDKWAVWNKSDKVAKISYTGPALGTGAGWTWEGTGLLGRGRMTFLQATPKTGIEFRLDFPDRHVLSVGTIEFEPIGKYTHVTWTLYGDAGANPMMRYMGPYMDAMIGPDFEASLDALKKWVELGR
jgi:uncharacterized protein YndB with AHSA1/START domain